MTKIFKNPKFYLATVALIGAVVLYAIFGSAEAQIEVENDWTETSANGLFVVSVDPQTNPELDHKIQINEFLEWIITIKTPEGKPVSPARVSVSGGMPLHGHGTPTQPQVSEYNGEEGQYLLKGLQFNMRGEWVMNFDITSESLKDNVTFNLKLTH